MQDRNNFDALCVNTIRTLSLDAVHVVAAAREQLGKSTGG